MNPRAAFTLVELSIVLVILGLLVGGVLTGQSLIKAAEMRSTLGQQQRYITAVQTFRDKYFSIPGDMTNAINYWGTDPGGCPPTANLVPKTATCNGNGDGVIGSGTSEMFLVWQHLANAGLIEGQYTGIHASGTNVHEVKANINVPAAKVSSGVWAVRGFTQGVNAGRFAGVYGNHFQLGAPIAGTWNDGGLLKPEDAYNMDMKIDDGKPGYGILVSNFNNSCTNGADSSSTTATYTLTNTAVACYLHFLWDGAIGR